MLEQVLLVAIDEARPLFTIFFGKPVTEDPADLEVRAHARDEHHHHPGDDADERYDGQRNTVERYEPEPEYDALPRVE